MEEILTVCVPLKSGTFEEVVNLSREVESEGGDLVEIWLDSLPFTHSKSRKDQKLLSALCGMIDLPILCVHKSHAEHGLFQGSEEDRIALLQKAVVVGVDYVDVGIQTDKHLIQALKNTIEEHGSITQLIISYHNYKETPEFDELKKKVLEAKKLGADIVKIATYANSESDNDIIFKLLDFIYEQGIRGIGVCMSGCGVRSRLKGCKHGSIWTYGNLEGKSTTADGQLTLQELKQ